MNPVIPSILQERPFEMITASAGTGKTYQLTNRLAALLLAGSAPREIAALTFTRTAAGEILAALLEKLARAARDPAAAALLAEHLGLSAPPAPERLEACLETLVRNFSLLTVGTLDGFFHRLASCFAFELGLQGPFRLMEAAEALENRDRVLGGMLARLPTHAPERKRLREACAHIFSDDQGKDFSLLLDRVVTGLHELHRRAGDPGAWLPENLPPELRAWLNDPADPAVLATDFARGLAESEAPPRALSGWEIQGPALLDWSPGKALTTPWNNIAGAVDLARGACAPFNLNGGKVHPSPGLQKAAVQLVSLWAARALRQAARRTAGLGALVRQYDEAYGESIRERGALVFSDLAPLLSSRAQGSPLLSLDLEYRLDSAYAHWLFDEFQDTSRTQWDVFKNLIDEVLSDPSRTRTFFCVGDPKQAIYGWRGGESRLMLELQKRYAGVLRLSPLDNSRRSVADVTSAINSLLRPSPGLEQLLPGAAALWKLLWRDHETARPASQRGAAAYVRPAPVGDSERADARHAAVAAVLRKLPLQQHGLTCAVLVPTNAIAEELSNYLTSGDAQLTAPILWRAKQNPSQDNPLGIAACALLRQLAHPIDSHSAGWLAASPLGPHLTDPAWRQRFRHRAAIDGFAATLGPLLQHLTPENDDFLRLRCRQLTDALRRADEACLTDPDAVWRRLEALEIVPAEQAGCVQVMTIHQSKGLGFDVVVVAGLAHGDGIDQRRDEPYTGLHPDGRPWILDTFKKELARQLPVLSEVHARDEQDAALEKLCLLYVAITRARHGLYLVGDPPRKTASSTVRWQNLIESAWPPGPPLETETSGDFAIEWLHREGLPGWWTTLPARDDTTTTPPELPDAFHFPSHPRLPARAPSAAATPAPWHRDPGPGLRLHALLAAAGPDPLASLPQWQAALKSADGPERTALESALNLVQAPGLRDVFSPPPETEVWIERSFDAVIDGVWITGRFDRVHLWRDKQGKPRAAALYDFKSSDPQLTGNPRPTEQLRLYRRALATLTGLPPDRIPCALVIPGSPPLLKPID